MNSKNNTNSLMHPSNCMVDCSVGTRTCTPNRSELKLIEMMERMAFHSCGWTAEDFQKFAKSAISKATSK